MTAIFFTKASEFREWLEKNHHKKNEIIVGFYKVNSGKTSITWSQSVDQALCFGWIDGVRKSINEESYCIRFTPRRKNSIWSAINIKKVEELTKAGLMKPEGEKSFSYKKDDKSKIYSHEKEASILNPDYENKFKDHKKAWDFFNKQSPSYQKITIHWIMGAKQEKTRQSRLEKIILLSDHQKRYQ
jgi:uncharacterized protein YdeI (YjbR/CyaY-like superfamily)